MPRPKNAIPTYRHHKQSGQAIVTVRTASGGRKDITLGAYNSPESKEEYRRVLANLEALSHAAAPTAALDVTVNELCLQYWKHAEEYYRHPDGTPTTELTDLKYAIRAFREKLGELPAREFGPLAFKAMRERMVAKGWARSTVNDQCGRVKRVVRWGVENELLPADRWEALRAVKGLAAGRTKAREPERIQPVHEEHVRAALPGLRPSVRALLELLALTGMRPGEACRIRPCDIDTSADVWVYRPRHHKTKYRGKERSIPLGTRARAILAPFTPTDPNEHFFSPARDDDARMAERAASRRTKRTPSQIKRDADRKGAARKRPKGKRYNSHAVAIAVSRACEKYNVPHWHPNQLRHTFATTVRKAHGLEAAQVLLGHARADVTQIYAERNLALAVQVASAIG